MKLPKLSLKHIDNRVKAALLTLLLLVAIVLLMGLILTYPAEAVVIVFLAIVGGVVSYFIWGMYRGILDMVNGVR